MLEPLTIEITPGQEQVMQHSGGLLKEFGFTIEPFGERTYLVRAVPFVLNGANLG